MVSICATVVVSCSVDCETFSCDCADAMPLKPDKSKEAASVVVNSCFLTIYQIPFPVPKTF